MIDAVTSGNVDTALAMYMELIGLQTAPQPILALVERQLRILLQVKELSSSRMDYGEIAKRVGLKPEIIRKVYLPAALRFREKALEDGLRSCVQADQDYKSGLISDRLAVEMVLVKLSGGVPAHGK
jgi:DNA polymerase-3 subunit delta